MYVSIQQPSKSLNNKLSSSTMDYIKVLWIYLEACGLRTTSMKQISVLPNISLE